MTAQAIARPIAQPVARRPVIDAGAAFIPDIQGITAYWPMGSGKGHILHELVSGCNGIPFEFPPGISLEDFTIGANAEGGQLCSARLAQWGLWKRVLTTAEKQALSANQKWPFDSTPSLRDASVYYLLDEASNPTTVADSTSNNRTLTKIGTGPVSVSGPGGGSALQFANNCRLAMPANGDIQAHDTSHTMAGWVNLDNKSLADQQIFFGQASLNTLDIGTVVYYHRVNDRFQADLSSGVAKDLSGNAVAVANNFGAPSLGTWYLLIVEYDRDLQTFSISVNDGTPDSISLDKLPRPTVGKLKTASQFVETVLYGNPTNSGWDVTGGCRYVVANNPAVTFGDRNRMVWGWCRIESGQNQTLLGYFDPVGNKLDWAIQYSAGLLYFLTGNTAGGFDFVSVPVTLNAWHLFVAWYDKTGDGKLHLNLNNGAEVATPATPVNTPAQTDKPICIGANVVSGFGNGNQFIGKLEAVGMASRVPTPSDIEYLWNSGNGIK